MLDFRSPPPLSGALIAGLPVRLLPTFPLAWCLQRFAATFCRLHPHVSGRLSDFTGRRLLLDPADLPLAFVLTLTNDIPRIAVVAQGQRPEYAVDATVRGALADLTALLEGKADGDALFFSRRLRVTGDMELVLALRNALDDARIDLRVLTSEFLGPLAPFGRGVLDAAVRGYTRLDTDLSLVARAAAAVMCERMERQAAEIERLRGDLDNLSRRLRRPRTHQQEKAGL